jgi:hypothetical protein
VPQTAGSGLNRGLFVGGEEEAGALFGGVGLEGSGDVGAGVEGDGDDAVPEPFGDDFGVDAAS